jgi:RNA polymerase sigma factor (sigma-70 family)
MTDDIKVVPSREAAFSVFYRAELDGQVRRAWLMLGDNEQANDIVHEAMAAVFERWHDLLEPGAYLNRSVLNGCRDAGRRKVSSNRLTRRLAVVEATQPEHDVLADALAGLSFNHRAAVVLRYYGGYTTAEIAESLGCAPGSVGPWIERGLAALRKVLL